MMKRLTKVGNSHALLLEKPVLDLLNISSDTMLEVKTDGERLIIQPVKDDDKDKNRKKATEGLKKAVKRYGGALKRMPEA
jgi:antitoxin MazE